MASNFKKLRKPALESTGDGKGKWFVNTECSMMSLMAVGSEWLDAIGLLGDDNNDRFYFNTELDAYATAADYYLFHHEIYPYADRWQELQALEGGKPNVAIAGSTVMEFE